jgi:hypothetical protein
MTEEQEENDEEADRTSSGEPKAVCSRQRKGRQFSRLSLAEDWGSGLGQRTGAEDWGGGFRQQREERVPSTNPGTRASVGGGEAVSQQQSHRARCRQSMNTHPSHDERFSMRLPCCGLRWNIPGRPRCLERVQRAVCSARWATTESQAQRGGRRVLAGRAGGSARRWGIKSDDRGCSARHLPLYPANTLLHALRRPKIGAKDTQILCFITGSTERTCPRQCAWRASCESEAPSQALPKPPVHCKPKNG